MAVASVPSRSQAGADSLVTKHLYYDDTELFSCSATVIAHYELKEGSKAGASDAHQQFVLVLDETVMHPQGGGQPADTGILSSSDGGIKFEVKHVQKPRGATHIEHIGQYCTDRQFTTGDEVRVEVDAARRMYHARLHSAGHLLDTAFVNIGNTDLIPEMGYHFPEGPYVEYVGNIPPEKREEVIQQLNKEAQKLIQDSASVIVTKNEKGERIVKVGGVECPCGGTHVKNVADIRGVTVTKIKKNKKNVRVSYVISEE